MNDEKLKMINDINFHGIPEFEGYSPKEMDTILYDTFGKNSTIQINKLSESEYAEIPILNQIKYLATLIGEKGELKLTTAGYLPPKIVKDVYHQ